MKKRSIFWGYIGTTNYHRKTRLRTNQELLEEISLLKQRIKELEALSEVKTLTGLIRICSFCKKIHNDKGGGWEKMEKYIRNHSEAEFSHGYCPECAEKVRSRFYLKK